LCQADYEVMAKRLFAPGSREPAGQGGPEERILQRPFWDPKALDYNALRR